MDDLSIIPFSNISLDKMQQCINAEICISNVLNGVNIILCFFRKYKNIARLSFYMHWIKKYSSSRNFYIHVKLKIGYLIHHHSETLMAIFNAGKMYLRSNMKSEIFKALVFKSRKRISLWRWYCYAPLFSYALQICL